jgi:hypothetical protein
MFSNDACVRLLAARASIQMEPAFA